MPQPGLHGVITLALRKRVTGPKWFFLGALFGSMLPDVDGYAQAFGVLVQGMSGHDAEAIYHRTLTHSIFFGLALGILFYVLSLIFKNKNLSIFGWGMFLGVALFHAVVDIFMWFDGVDILWPLFPGVVDIWNWVTVPELGSKLLQAANYWMFLWFLWYLGSIARKEGTDAGYLPKLNKSLYLQGGLALIFTVLAFILSPVGFTTPNGVAFLFVAFPNALIVTWRMRETVEA